MSLALSSIISKNQNHFNLLASWLGINLVEKTTKNQKTNLGLFDYANITPVAVIK